MPTVSRAVREILGLEPDEEPLFWPDGRDLSNPSRLAYLRKAQIWIHCAGDASSPVSVLYGPPNEGFEWQITGRQFADYRCSWPLLIRTYENPYEEEEEPPHDEAAL